MLFTVFTPTFNRAHTLHRVFDSLAAQTLRDFEWLVVDDGSDDGTTQLVGRWRATGAFPVRYVRQPNLGKHVAHNRAVGLAAGTLFLTLDSDDGCVPSALERLNRHWLDLPDADRDRFVGVTGLCVTEDGRIVGDRFPADVFDSDPRETYYRHRIRGEKWGFSRTDVLRRFPFAETVTGSWVPEASVWFRIASEYRTRYVNEALRIYYTDVPSLMRRRPLSADAAGKRQYYLERLREDLAFFRVAPDLLGAAAANYVRFSLHAGRRARADRKGLAGTARALVAAASPLGYALYVRDRWRDARVRTSCAT